MNIKNCRQLTTEQRGNFLSPTLEMNIDTKEWRGLKYMYCKLYGFEDGEQRNANAARFAFLIYIDR